MIRIANTSQKRSNKRFFDKKPDNEKGKYAFMERTFVDDSNTTQKPSINQF